MINIEEKSAKAAAQQRKWRAANPDKAKAISLKHYTNHKDKINAATVGRNRKRQYGVSQDQFDDMLASQSNSCAICQTTEPGSRAFHVDHCHETQQVRGLLCHHCNTGLGLFRDNTALLMRATEYLDAARTLH
jgi:hypothetical protein